MNERHPAQTQRYNAFTDLPPSPFRHQKADERFPAAGRELERNVRFVDGRTAVGTKNFALVQKNSGNLAAGQIEQDLLRTVRNGRFRRCFLGTP